MKKLYTCISLIILMITSQSNIVKSQNLIPNPGFEIYDTCPYKFKLEAWKWQNIEFNPDLYNSCASGNSFSVPDNYFGHQFAHSGCGYEGIGCFDSNGSNEREFLQAKLDSALNIGLKYYISFNLSLHDLYPGFWSGTNKFGCKLSVNSFSPGDDGSPAIDNYATFYSDSIVIDTAGWVSIHGSFIADSAYNYITFGCFFDDQHVQHLVLNGPRIFTYYYLDDVCLSSDSLTCISVSQPCYVPNSVEEIEVNKHLVYPNPIRKSDDIIHLDIPTDQKYILHLYNLLGEKIFVASGNKYVLELQLNKQLKKCNPGLFQLNLLNEKQESLSAKLSIY